MLPPSPSPADPSPPDTLQARRRMAARRTPAIAVAAGIAVEDIRLRRLNARDVQTSAAPPVAIEGLRGSFALSAAVRGGGEGKGEEIVQGEELAGQIRSGGRASPLK